MTAPLLRRALLGASALLLFSLPLQGCATLHPSSYTSPVPETFRRSIRTVAVVPVASDAGGEFKPSGAVGAGDGALHGLGVGAMEGAGAGLQLSLGTGPFAPPAAAILVPVLTTTGAAGGSGFGAITAIPKKDAAAANEALSRSRTDLGTIVARRVKSLLPSAGKRAVEAHEGMPDARLELSVNRWGLAGGSGSDPETSFFIEVSWRISRGTDGSEAVGRNSMTEGSRHRISEWTADIAALLRRAVDDALTSSAETVVDSAFLVRDFRVAGDLSLDRYCGLEALSPGCGFRLTPIPLTAPEVPVLSPLLRWEPFPRKRDLEDDPGKGLSRVTAVRYDLRVWKSEKGRQGELVYERRGLELPVTEREIGGSDPQDPRKERSVGHTLEMTLSPKTGYLWSVRARFLLDGKERVTRWSFFRDASRKPMSCAFDAIPPGFHYRFRTP